MKNYSRKKQINAMANNCEYIDLNTLDTSLI